MFIEYENVFMVHPPLDPLSHLILLGTHLNGANNLTIVQFDIVESLSSLGFDE